jgi:hypothetical protein
MATGREPATIDGGRSFPATETAARSAVPAHYPPFRSALHGDLHATGLKPIPAVAAPAQTGRAVFPHPAFTKTQVALRRAGAVARQAAEEPMVLHDSPLERNGFELPVLRENGYRSAVSISLKLFRFRRRDLPTSGTEVSNPRPSSGESANFWFLANIPHGSAGTAVDAKMSLHAEVPLVCPFGLGLMHLRIMRVVRRRDPPASGSIRSLLHLSFLTSTCRAGIAWRDQTASSRSAGDDGDRLRG